MRLGRFRTGAGRTRYLTAYRAAMSLMPAPSRTEDAKTTFGTVRAYTWEGDEPDRTPVLLLPGQRSGVPMWEMNLPELLSSGRTVVAFDALGDAGMSVQTLPLRTAADQARWTNDALVSLNLRRVHSVGHSFGGATAAGHALYHAESVASVALLEPVCTFRWLPPSVFFWATVVMLPVPRSWRDRALAAIGGVPVDEVRAPSPIGELIAAATETYASSLPTPRPLSDEQLSRIRMPAYVAIADHRSLAGGDRAAARARRSLPRATVDVWPDTSHSLPMQVPGPLGQRLRDFWDEVDRM